jgi:hypothetical protein
MIDVVYQVIDVCAAHAGATSTMDALDVGLVCIRNLQVCTFHLSVLPLPSHSISISVFTFM